MKHLSEETKLQTAIQMVIMDAIEKWATKEDILEFMKTEQFESVVLEYVKLMNQ